MKLGILMVVSTMPLFSQNTLFNESIQRMRAHKGTPWDRVAVLQLSAWKLIPNAFYPGKEVSLGFRSLRSNSLRQNFAKEVSTFDFLDGETEMNKLSLTDYEIRKQFERDEREILLRKKKLLLQAVPANDLDRYGSEFRIRYRRITITGEILWGSGYFSQTFKFKWNQ